MNHTLVVYEEVPERTSMFLIPNDVMEQNNWLPLLLQANGKFVNNDDNNEGMDFVVAATMQEKYRNTDSFDEGTPKEWRCALTAYRKEPTDLLDVRISRVIFTGFIL